MAGLGFRKRSTSLRRQSEDNSSMMSGLEKRQAAAGETKLETVALDPALDEFSTRTAQWMSRARVTDKRY
jgi:hypothetical protein